MIPDTAPVQPASTTTPLPVQEATALRGAAEALEASFLAEMLRHSGVGKPVAEFGGGAGEDAFAGFLADAYAERIVQSGGIGLAENIFRALAQRSGAE